MQSIIVNKKYDGKQLDKILLDTFPGLTIDTFYKALRKKDIRVNNIRLNKNINVHAGDEIKIFVIDELLYKHYIPQIIYQDNNILIANKPANKEVLGDNSLTNDLNKYLNTCVEPCHRLDRNTTGLILFAKNKQALSILLDKFKKHEIEKHYLATVYGIPKSNNKKLVSYLFKDSKKSLVYISDEPKKGYVKIETSYTILEKHAKENYSILDVTLHTGKTHQIRAHLAHIGNPILGDGKYGNNKINKQFGYTSQALCSYILKFNFFTDSGILDYLNGKEFKLNI